MILEIGQRYQSARNNGTKLLWHFHGRSPVDGKFIMEYIGKANNHGIYMFDEDYATRTYGVFTPVPYETKPVV